MGFLERIIQGRTDEYIRLKNKYDLLDEKYISHNSAYSNAKDILYHGIRLLKKGYFNSYCISESFKKYIEKTFYENICWINLTHDECEKIENSECYRELRICRDLLYYKSSEYYFDESSLKKIIVYAYTCWEKLTDDEKDNIKDYINNNFDGFIMFDLLLMLNYESMKLGTNANEAGNELMNFLKHKICLYDKKRIASKNKSFDDIIRPDKGYGVHNFLSIIGNNESANMSAEIIEKFDLKSSGFHGFSSEFAIYVKDIFCLHRCQIHCGFEYISGESNIMYSPMDFVRFCREVLSRIGKDKVRRISLDARGDEWESRGWNVSYVCDVKTGNVSMYGHNFEGGEKNLEENKKDYLPIGEKLDYLNKSKRFKMLFCNIDDKWI